MRTRRPILQPGRAFRIPAGEPPVSTLTGDTHRLGDVSDRPTLLADTLNNETTPMDIESGVTVSHEDLLWGCGAITTPIGGLHSSKTVTNVPAEYT